MGENVRKDKFLPRLKVLNLLLLISFVLTCFTGYWLYKNLKTEKEKTSILIKQVEESENRNKTLEENKALLIETIGQIKDPSEQLEELKKEYFAKAKELETLIQEGKTDLKIAYLTFDDGPYLKSEYFLDTLDKYNVKGTFFYLMKTKETGFADVDAQYEKIYQRIIKNGHTLGNHTATHRLREDSLYETVDKFIDDLLRNRLFIYDRYGYTTTVMRFPGGSGSAGSRKQGIVEKAKDEGYCYVDWDVETGDGMYVLSVEESVENVLKNTNGRSIIVVLMHDYSQPTLDALPQIIEGLTNQGYIFLPMFNGSIKCKN